MNKNGQRGRLIRIDGSNNMKGILKKIIIKILTLEAKLILWRYKPKIIAVGGSVGKTSTKEAISAVLEGSFNIRKSEKSYNSEIGAPLTVIGAKTGWGSFSAWLSVIARGLNVFLFAKNYPEILILETGVGKPKDMENLVSWIKPDVAVMTAIGEVPVHTEKFGSPEELIKEKRKLAEAVKENGWLILNADDKVVAGFEEKDGSQKIKTVFYGFSERADLIVSDYRMSGEGITFKINHGEDFVSVKLDGFYGRHNVYGALASVAVGISQGVSLAESARKLANVKSQPGRLNLVAGIKDSLIFDDSYNSSPSAVGAAVEVLAEYPAKRRIAVLGSMRELGDFSQSEHERIGATLRDKNIWLLFTVGDEAKFFAEGARRSGFDEQKIFEFDNSGEAGDKLKDIIQEGDLILVKGSQSARMERAVEKIMAHPEEKEKLLVRQEKEWEKR